MIETSVQIVGWAGMILILLAYFLVSYKKVDSDSKTYQLMNAIGVIGTGINAFYQRAWPVFVLQVIWSVIAVITLVKIIQKK